MSYSRRDARWLERLRPHLRPLERDLRIEVWSDAGIEPGQAWREEIGEALGRAGVAVLLVSADFLASEFITREELPPLLEAAESRGTVVLPLIVRPCRFAASRLAGFQAVNDPAHPLETVSRGAQEKVFVRLAERIEAVFGPSPAVAMPPPRRTERPASRRPAPSGIAEAESRAPELRYSNLFQVASLQLPYVSLIGGWDKGVNELRRGEVTSRTLPDLVFALPEDFRPADANSDRSEAKCRLERYDCDIMPGSQPNRLTFTFSRIRYRDYLASGERLDEPLPGDPSRTFRDEYAPRLDLRSFGRSRLTNICGVGIFLLTRDDRLIVARHSPDVRVYGGILSYSASGTMDWREEVHPFDEVARECFEEIGHRVDDQDALLFGFGIDTKKLYFQFSFFERTGVSSREVLRRARLARDFSAEIEELQAVAFDLDTIVRLVREQPWEPAAAAGLLTLATKEFGLARLENALDRDFVRRRTRSEMVAEWDHRASRPGDLAVMSARYPFHRCEEESARYVQAVLEFLGDDLAGRRVLELGAGNGRLTEHLVERAGRLTALDLSGTMLDCNRLRLGRSAADVDYLQAFAQDHRPASPYDALVCSLVLIHNVDERDFRRLVEVMSSAAETIFLFEHTDVSYQVSSHTRPRGEPELRAAFDGYRIERRREYLLFNDNLIFLKLVR